MDDAGVRDVSNVTTLCGRLGGVPCPRQNRRPVIIHEKLEICRNSIINIALIRRLVTELEELIMINQTDKFLNLGK